MTSDDDFWDSVALATRPAAAFKHRDHIRLAWIGLRRFGVDAAGDAVGRAIRAFATHHGAADKYHETITQAWVQLVATACAASPDVQDFDTLVARHPALLDKTLLHRFYSPECLASDAARAAWIDPDRAPIAAP